MTTSAGRRLLLSRRAHEFISQSPVHPAVNATLHRLATADAPYSGGAALAMRLAAAPTPRPAAGTVGGGSGGGPPSGPPATATPGSGGIWHVYDSDEAAAVEVITVLRITDEEIIWTAPDHPIWSTQLRKGGTRARRVPARRHAVSPRRLTDAAAFLAGRKRERLRDEWLCHLAGELGRVLTRKDQLRAARGFLWAALRLRLQDAAASAWRPADAVLGSRTLSNLFVWGPVTVMLVAIVRHDSRFGLVADVQDPAALGAFLYGVIRTGRWWRGVKPPEPKPRRIKE
jgi:hypothetical protein